MELQVSAVVYHLYSENVKYLQSLRVTTQTKRSVRKHLVHKLVVPLVPRQCERFRRDVLELVSRVFLVEPLGRWRRLLPLQTNRSCE